MRTALALGIVTALAGAACTHGKPASTASSAPPTAQQIPQPDVGNLPVAPLSQRVDVRVPTFSHPTNVTNPLFPVSEQHSVLFVGHVDNKPFRTEVTLLPYTRIVAWAGQRIECLVSQYVAYLGGRLQEVAFDLYAQADDGSVWYFGEDVADLEHGDIVSKEGTWIVGRDGPGAMIMPGHPQVGQAYRTENIPGIAFEQVTVTNVNKTLDGPLGPIPGGMVGQELHMDGKTEDKLFAPGYGEFYTKDGPDVEALAMAVPTDAASAPVPAELVTMRRSAMAIFDAARSRDWSSASSAMKDMTTAWQQAQAATGEVPRLLGPVVSGALDSLVKAINSRDPVKVRGPAIEAARWSLDLQLRYLPSVQIDLGRVDLWAAQVLVDAASHDQAQVNGDIFTIQYLRDRILSGLDATHLNEINIEIGDLWTASADGDLGAATDAANQMRQTLAQVMTTS